MATWTVSGKPWLERFNVFVGTSAGAVYSALFASGLTPKQIRTLVECFGGPSMPQLVFDWNFVGAATALLRLDAREALGAIRGDGILALMETVMSKHLRAKLQTLLDTAASTNDSRALRQFLKSNSKRNLAAAHDLNYYSDQYTFGDTLAMGRAVYIIGTNLYTGQKTIFCYLANPSDMGASDEYDEWMSKASTFDYFNDDENITRTIGNQEQELEASGETMLLDSKFQRFENRIYRRFDPLLYGEQLPLALAVRSSMCIPVLFEPARIKRRTMPGEPSLSYDLFIDGGVDDNLSLSCAADPYLGNAREVLGVSLGNLGRRLPDANATASCVSVLMKTTDFFGDAITDLQRVNSEYQSVPVTILDALPSVQAKITDTQSIAALVQDGEDIAKDFWALLHNLAYPDGAVTVDPSAIFREPGSLRVGLSKAAMAGPLSPPLRPVASLPLRLVEVVAIPVRRVQLGWLAAYGFVAALLLAVGVTLVALARLFGALFAGHVGEAGNEAVWIGLGAVWVIAGIFLVRLVGYLVWRKYTLPHRSRPSRTNARQT
jgi:predicted acylesterase/phospholipase RssA